MFKKKLIGHSLSKNQLIMDVNQMSVPGNLKFPFPGPPIERLIFLSS